VHLGCTQRPSLLLLTGLFNSNQNDSSSMMQPQYAGSAEISSQPPSGGAYQSYNPPQIDGKSMMQQQYTSGGTPVMQQQYTSGGTPVIQSQYANDGPPTIHPPSAYPPAYSQPHVYDPNMPEPPLSGERGSPAPAPQGIRAPRVYQTAMPIMALNESAAPVDCTVCGQRALTRTEYNVGTTTQCVLASPCSSCFQS
jgi:hypothetical protein